MISQKLPELDGLGPAALRDPLAIDRS